MGEALSLGSAVVWALTTIVMRPIAGTALLSASLVRLLTGSVLLVAYAWPTGALARLAAAPPSAWLWLTGSTLCALVVGDSLFFAASSRVGVARALPVASAFPLVATAGAVAWLGEPLSLTLVVGTVLVVAGVVAIAGERAVGGPTDRASRVGLALAGLAAVCWAASGLLLGQGLHAVDALAANALRFPMGSVLVGGVVLVRRRHRFVAGRERWLALLAGVGTVGSAMLFLTSIQRAGAARAIALNATSPIFAALFAAWLLRERLSARAAVGILSSVVGSALLVA